MAKGMCGNEENCVREDASDDEEVELFTLHYSRRGYVDLCSECYSIAESQLESRAEDSKYGY